MDVAYPQIAERLFGRAHAIEPAALRAIMDGPIARRVLGGDKVSGKQAKKDRGHRHARLAAISGAESVRTPDGLVEYALTPEGVAIVPIAGVLSRRFDWLAAACGFTTYEGLSATIGSALEDFRVRAILLDVDTPGGEAAGMLDVADAILAAREQKPIWAVANTLAASAGYALAGSASRLLLPRLAQVGSIGCVMVHVDQSLRDAAGGLIYTAIYSGARKIDGWGHAPLSAGALDAAQADVDHVRDVFADLIGRQGRMSAKAALSTEAACYSDADAVKAGLADAVMTFDDALAELTDTLENPMATKAALNSSTSAGTIAVADEATRRAAAEAAPAAATAAAAAPAPAPAAAKDKTEDMTPPKPGEKCALCGQTMPDDGGDEDGNDQDQETRAAPAQPAAAATAPAAEYSAADASETLELCAIARQPMNAAQAFIAAKMPVAKVRAELARRAADAGDAVAIDTAAAPNADKEKAVAAAWDTVVGDINAKMGFKPK